MNEYTAQQIHDLEERLENLARLVVETQAEVRETRDLIRSTTEFYEQRLDQVYRRVTISLREYLALPALDAPSEIEVDAVMSRAFGTVLKGGSGLSSDELRGALSPELKPGILSGPLTVRGFKLNRAAARELGTSIFLSGAVSGIAVYGPYKSLVAGRYRIIARLRVDKSRSVSIVPNKPLSALRSNRKFAKGWALGAFALDVHRPETDQVYSASEHPKRDGKTGVFIETTFDWPGGEVEFRLQNNSQTSWHLIEFELEFLEKNHDY